MDRLKIAILGCGTWAGLIIENVYTQLRDIGQLVATVDQRLDRAERLAAPFGARAYRSLQEAMDHEKIDAVDIRLHHAAHAPAVLEAVSYGKHVLVEKPFATSVEDGERMVAAAKTANVVLSVSENYAFLEQVRVAKRLLAENVIGRLLAVRSARVFPITTAGGIWIQDPWRLDVRRGGGVLLDQGCHHVNMVRRLVGEITHVHAFSDAIPGQKPEDTAVLNLRFANGVIGQQLYCWNTKALDAQLGPEAILTGEDGTIEIHMTYVVEGGGVLLHKPDLPGGQEWRYHGANYFASTFSVVDDWVRACRGEKKPAMPGEEGLRDIKVVMAAFRSIETGCEVVVE